MIARSVADRRRVAAITPAPTPSDQPEHGAAEGERGGHRKVARDDRGHRLLREERFTQVAAGQSSQEREVLHAHRLVEAQARAHDRDRLLARLTAGDQPRDVARHGEVDDEHARSPPPRPRARSTRDDEGGSGSCRLLAESRGEAESRRGSSASRTLSPSTLNATVVMSSAAPGKNTNHHATL